MTTSARSTEYYGLGQSGYTAGRVGGDRALGLEGRNIAFPRGVDEHVLACGDDERFLGLGGVAWAPDESNADQGNADREHRR
jgi:hypothetical protein